MDTHTLIPLERPRLRLQLFHRLQPICQGFNSCFGLMGNLNVLLDKLSNPWCCSCHPCLHKLFFCTIHATHKHGQGIFPSFQESIMPSMLPGPQHQPLFQDSSFTQIFLATQPLVHFGMVIFQYNPKEIIPQTLLVLHILENTKKNHQLCMEWFVQDTYRAKAQIHCI